MGRGRAEREKDKNTEDTVRHPWHAHRLKLKHYSADYTCSACRDGGFGFRYRCDACDYDLHSSCAHSPQMSRHPSHPDHPLVLHQMTFDGPRTCDVCDEDIMGALYSCSNNACIFDVHPTCMKLPLALFHAVHPNHRIDLYVPLGDGNHSHRPPPRSAFCNICSGSFKAGVASYGCSIDDCDFYVHVPCAKMPVDPMGGFHVPSAGTDALMISDASVSTSARAHGPALTCSPSSSSNLISTGALLDDSDSFSTFPSVSRSSSSASAWQSNGVSQRNVGRVLSRSKALTERFYFFQR